LFRQLALMMRGQPDLGEGPALGEDQVVERHVDGDETGRGLLAYWVSEYCLGFLNPRDLMRLGAVPKLTGMQWMDGWVGGWLGEWGGAGGSTRRSTTGDEG
jgi:hypothetical protein